MDIKKHAAFDFWKQHMGDEKHDIHCSAVINACLGMITGTDMQQEIFVIAGWIHDMGKLIDKKKHHVESLKYLNKFIQENDEYEKWRKELHDCILNHRTGFKPSTIYGYVMQVADKVALHNFKWLAFKQNENRN